jgi:hypothetical protein
LPVDFVVVVLLKGAGGHGLVAVQVMVACVLVL